ncbi:MAG: hypothetical protein KKE50_02060 [Nanoarchaeota archaeon]|nr:hypothetical protein [Nanoarchaeota archaeon]
MKITKLNKKTCKITRETISRIGEAIYGIGEVKSVSIEVGFSDGSRISFNREEDEDEMEMLASELGED